MSLNVRVHILYLYAGKLNFYLEHIEIVSSVFMCNRIILPLFGNTRSLSVIFEVYTTAKIKHLSFMKKFTYLTEYVKSCNLQVTKQT